MNYELILFLPPRNNIPPYFSPVVLYSSLRTRYNKHVPDTREVFLMKDLTMFFKYSLVFLVAWGYPILLIILAQTMPQLFPSVLISSLLTAVYYIWRHNRKA